MRLSPETSSSSEFTENVKIKDFSPDVLSEFGLEIVESNHSIPAMEKLDFSSVHENSAIKLFAGNIIDFLNAPKIRYMTSDNHDDRRAIRDAVTQRYGEKANLFLANDKMKLNKFSTFPLFVEQILRNIPADLDPAERTKLNSVLLEFPTIEEVRQYHGMSNEEKQTLIGGFEDAGVHFLELFKTPFSSEPQSSH